jgi:PAS domain S-box-containing protein
MNALPKRLTLFHKGVFLALVSLAFVVIPVYTLSTHLAKAATESNRVQRLEQMSALGNEIIQELHTIMVVTVTKTGSAESEITKALNKLSQTLDALEPIVHNEPEKLKVIADAREGIAQSRGLLDEYVQVYMSNKGKLPEQFVRVLVQRKYAAMEKMLGIVPALRDDQTPVDFERELENEASLQQFLIAMIALSVAISLGSVIVVSKVLNNRLAILTDNAFRLASNVPLNPPISGSDEIAELDTMFHAMADAVATTAKKENAIINNAADIICSIDANGRFTAVNPAVQKVLGRAPDDLIGTYYVDLIPTRDAVKTMDAIESAMKGNNPAPIETSLKRKDNTTIDVSWSVHWAAEERSAFCVIHDITEAVAARKAKQEMIAMLTHDLRTPLTTIQHVLEMLSLGSIGKLNERGAKLCVAADLSATRMLTLIKDLLDIEKMKAGMMNLQKQEIDVAMLFQQSHHSIAGFAEEMGVRVSVQDTDLFATVDQDRIVQVLVNLISNAIKFSHKGGLVSVTAEAEGSMVRISVKDEGRGIPADKLDTVFERFQQVQKGDSLQKGGSGLGLAICKAIVELHGGSISVTSQAGEGSTFSFTVPA